MTLDLSRPFCNHQGTRFCKAKTELTVKRATSPCHVMLCYVYTNARKRHVQPAMLCSQPFCIFRAPRDTFSEVELRKHVPPESLICIRAPNSFTRDISNSILRRGGESYNRIIRVHVHLHVHWQCKDAVLRASQSVFRGQKGDIEKSCLVEILVDSISTSSKTYPLVGKTPLMTCIHACNPCSYEPQAKSLSTPLPYTPVLILVTLSTAFKQAESCSEQGTSVSRLSVQKCLLRSHRHFGH